MDVYEIVTEKIVAELESGTVPWRKPWGTEPPANLRSGKAYRGVNVFLLAVAPFASPYWVTFRQARDLGGAVRAGEKGRPVVFWTWYEKRSEKKPARPDADAKDRRIPVLRYYTVFNVEQCDGLTIPAAASQPIPFAPIERAESIVAGMPEPPGFEHGQAAFYVPSTDTVTVPPPGSFRPAEEYYATLFHELGHATGHPRRLDRPSLVGGHGHGTHEYSREELVAEMTAAFLCAHAGIAPATLSNAAAYLGGWLLVLRGDSRLVVQAAAAAQKAAEYVLGTSSELPAEDSTGEPACRDEPRSIAAPS